MKNWIIFIVLLTIVLSGCTAIDVRKIDARHKISHVCIEENPKVIVPGFVAVVENGFVRHGISTEMYSGEMPSHCEYKLTYTALRSWDFVTYLSHAELRLYRGSERIGFGQFHLVGKGGFALTKWRGVKSKMDPVIDELLSQY